jgi:hypothetical protein
MDTQECEPRLLRLRRRIAQAEAPRQPLVDADALQTALPLMMGRLEDCAAQGHTGFAEADWGHKRDVIRALVKRVAVARDDVHIVFRIDPYAGDADPEKKVCHFVGGVRSPRLMNVALHGLETAITMAFPASKDGHRWRPRVIRFADDLVVLHRDYHAIAQAQDIAAHWLHEMG